MKDLNPLKIGKYTIGISLGIAVVSLFGFLISMLCGYVSMAKIIATGGMFYMYYIAVWVNLAIFLFLQIYGCCYKKKLKESFIGASMILFNMLLTGVYLLLELLLFAHFKTIQ